MTELLITLTIVVILAKIAVPQFTYAIQAQQSTAVITNLLNDMQYARSEAMKEGQEVSVCVSSNQTSCTSGTWDTGWMVYSNPTAAAAFVSGTSVKLRAQAGSSAVTIATGPTTGVTVVNFNRDGFAMNLTAGSGLLFQLHTTTTNSSATRCLWMSTLGNAYIQKAGATALTGQGTNKCT